MACFDTMLFFSLQGPLRQSEGSAVAAAIAEALSSYGGRGQKIHTHVVQVIEDNGQFRAQIQIGVEPALEEKAEPVLTPAPRQRRPESIKRKIDLEKRLQPKKRVSRSEPHPEPHPQQDIHVYLYAHRPPDISYSRHLFEPHPDYYYHVIGDSSIWEATRKIYPDVAFYEATHPAPVLQPDEGQGPAQRLILDKKRRPKGMNLDLDQEEEF